jgi:hypothetical protein
MNGIAQRAFRIVADEAGVMRMAVIMLGGVLAIGQLPGTSLASLMACL